MRFARLAGVGGFILGSFASPAAKPTVTLVRSSPVVVAGSGYTAGARVVVDYRSGATHVRRRVRATIAGRFRVVFQGVTLTRCNGAAVTAAGASTRIAPCTLLHGTVRIGPTTPVCRAEVPCSKPAARVVLSFTRRSVQVQVRTDALGRYRARLAPGTWTFSTRIGIRPAPIRFVVPRALSAKRDFSIDTGIR